MNCNIVDFPSQCARYRSTSHHVRLCTQARNPGTIHVGIPTRKDGKEMKGRYVGGSVDTRA